MAQTLDALKAETPEFQTCPWSSGWDMILALGKEVPGRDSHIVPF